MAQDLITSAGLFIYNNLLGILITTTVLIVFTLNKTVHKKVKTTTGYILMEQ